VIFLGNDYIYSKVEKLVRRFGTRNPLEILERMNVIVGETSNYKKLKGYCFMSCRIIYVMINSFLPAEERRMVAAHELGHIILHRERLKVAPMKDDVLYDMRDETEYEANLFAADLLLEDADIAGASEDEDMDYFGFCSSLNVSPELMSFKLYSLMRRGHVYNMPMDIKSDFMKK
jgi:Zn-dependent peptidase ImmA (M78 family)